MSKLIHGVFLNDADYTVCPKIEGKRVWCPFYTKWLSMIKRCYSKTTKGSSYTGCSVDPEWYLFSNFKAWMEKQDWEGKELDKDLLIVDNLLYSPATCIFVSSEINNFLTDRKVLRGKYPIGVCLKGYRYVAQISNGNGKPITLGYYDTPNEAHDKWLKHKRQRAMELASKQTDSRISDALISRYAGYDLRECNHDGSIMRGLQ